MESPFVFGKIAKGNSFVNRKKELNQLTVNFTSGINSMLISPRRWGKSSLVSKVAKQVEKNNKGIRICYLDLFRIKDEDNFYEIYTREVLKASSNKWQEWVSTAKELLSGLVSSISFGSDPSQDFSIRLSWDGIQKDEHTLLDLPEKIAEKKNFRMIICIDEFQKIAEFKNGMFLQEKLRSHWQDHKRTSYCLYGSKRHIINHMFTSQSQPFFRFGDLIFLQKIEEKHWYRYIDKQFKATGRTIQRDTIERILKITANHPYHIQQLAHHLWRLNARIADNKSLETSLNELILNNEILFKKEVESLTALQLRYLAALLNKESHLNSQQTISKYRLGSPGNLGTIKSALESKEIIDFFEMEPAFINPLFEYWLREIYQLKI